MLFGFWLECSMCQYWCVNGKVDVMKMVTLRYVCVCVSGAGGFAQSWWSLLRCVHVGG